ncbi:hypothetical protein P7C73_g5994, partial [Tremellales sp. Uapishka_1]
MSERTPLLSGSVNGPSTNSLPSQRDIQNNLPSKGQRIQVAQAAGALQAGKAPSQAQISKILQVILDSETLRSTGGPNSRTARLGAEGQNVLENGKGVLAAIKAWGEAKNGDDLLQNFFYNAATADVNIDANGPSAPSTKELNKDAQRAIDSFRTIASLIVTNDNFRQLGSDIILISRDILADAASVAADSAKDAAEKSRPSEQERKQGVDFDKLAKKGKKTAKGARSGKLGGEARESLWDGMDNVKEYLDDKLPDGDEAKDQLIQRLRDVSFIHTVSMFHAHGISQVVTQAQSDPQYKKAIHGIVGLVKKYAHKAEDALEETKDKSNVDDEDEKVQQAGRDLKTFVEKVANKSLDDVIKASRKAADDIKNDDKLSAYFDELDKFIDRLLYQPGYVVSQRAYRKASSLYDDGQSLITENSQWKADAAELQKQFEGIVNGVANDGPTNKLVEALEELGDSLATAGQIGLGSLKVDGQGLYRDFVDVILPRLIGLVKEIPVPRVEFKSEDLDLVIDDIKLESASFIPDSIRFVAHNDLRFTQGYATYASEYDASVRLRVQGLHFSASNIAFWVSKKTGFMPFEDSGILDIQFGPKGIDFDVTLENADEDDRETFFTVKDVTVQISGFDFSISKNSKWFATWFAKPILRAFVQRNLTSALEAQIAEYLKTADLQMYGVQQRAIAATNAKPTPLNFVKAVFSDSIFSGSSGGPVKAGPKGVVKYGRRGEYILHIGVDEDLFENKPPASIANTQRQKLKAKAKAVSNQASGSADSVKKNAQDAADKGKKEANELDAKAKEAKRREERTEGWRSEAFDV